MNGPFGGMVLALGLVFAGAAAAGELDGRWLTASGNAEIVFAPCGPALCGSVERIIANNSMDGPGTSTGTPLQVGMKIVTDLVPGGSGEWNGKLFDRENGKTYDCVIKPMGGTMSVRAYVWTPLFGQSQTWTRTSQ